MANEILETLIFIIFYSLFPRLFRSSVRKSRFHICVLNVNFSFTAHDASLSSNHTQTCTKKMFRINIMLDKRRETIISKSKVQFITRIVWCAWYNFHDRNIKGTQYEDSQGNVTFKGKVKWLRNWIIFWVNIYILRWVTSYIPGTFVITFVIGLSWKWISFYC